MRKEYQCPPGRMATLNIDLIHMRRSERFNYCLTIICRMTSFFLVIPQRTTNSTETLRNLIAHQVAHFGPPLKIVSDRGSTFTSNTWQEGMKVLGIEHTTTCAFAPFSNGKIERSHEAIKRAIRCAGQADNWSRGIHLTMLALRSTICTDDGYTPNMKLYGQEARIPGILIDPAEYRHFTSQDAQELIQFLDMEKERIKRKRKEQNYLPKTLMQCSMVMVKVNERKDKHSPLYTGPHLVLERHEKYFRILKGRKADNVSIQRLKAAHQLPIMLPQELSEDDPQEIQKLKEQPQQGGGNDGEI